MGDHGLIDLLQDKDRWRSVINMAMNSLVP